MPRLSAITIAFVAIAIAATTAQAAPQSHQQLQVRLQKSESVIQFFTNLDHVWLRAPRQENCRQVPWTRSCRIAREKFMLHKQRAVKLRHLLDRAIPMTGNWTRAVRYAQRPFPGTEGWLFAISGRECRACYTVDGGFVCNYGGSGACGPMQFMSGTFYAHAPDARAWMSEHGWIVDPVVWDWHNALGQALTAAYMRYTGQDGCHWCL